MSLKILEFAKDKYNSELTSLTDETKRQEVVDRWSKIFPIFEEWQKNINSSIEVTPKVKWDSNPLESILLSLRTQADDLKNYLHKDKSGALSPNVRPKKDMVTDKKKLTEAKDIGSKIDKKLSKKNVEKTEDDIAKGIVEIDEQMANFLCLQSRGLDKEFYGTNSLMSFRTNWAFANNKSHSFSVKKDGKDKREQFILFEPGNMNDPMTQLWIKLKNNPNLNGWNNPEQLQKRAQVAQLKENNKLLKLNGQKLQKLNTKAPAFNPDLDITHFITQEEESKYRQDGLRYIIVPSAPIDPQTGKRCVGIHKNQCLSFFNAFIKSKPDLKSQTHKRSTLKAAYLGRTNDPRYQQILNSLKNEMRLLDQLTNARKALKIATDKFGKESENKGRLNLFSEVSSASNDSIRQAFNTWDLLMKQANLPHQRKLEEFLSS